MLVSSSPRCSSASVAAAAGVSIATVSKVVNGRSDVGPATRARVQTALEQHDYVGRRTDSASGRPADATVELVMHGALSGYFLEVLEGVVEAATDAGVAVAVSVRPRAHGSEGSKRSMAWARRLARLRRTAVIDVVDDVRHGDLSALARSRLPLVVIDPANEPSKQVTSVGTTNFAGGRAATEYLLGLGHRRIAYQGTVAGGAYNQARAHGFRAAMKRPGCRCWTASSVTATSTTSPAWPAAGCCSTCPSGPRRSSRRPTRWRPGWSRPRGCGGCGCLRT